MHQKSISFDVTREAFSIALVNYKTPEMTRICLNMLEKALKKINNVKVWVVDNNSQDASTEYLKTVEWINLIERQTTENEKGYIAHGEALDLVLKADTNQYLFLMHTDTLIHDPEIFDIFLSQMKRDPNIAVIGCLEQIDRGYFRRAWRVASRFMTHFYRRARIHFNLSSKEPKPYIETHLKSFFALWNTALLKKHHLSFSQAHRIPGYAAQDQLSKLNYSVIKFPVSILFKYLDHVEAATISAQGGYHMAHRRTKNYLKIIKKYETNTR